MPRASGGDQPFLTTRERRSRSESRRRCRQESPPSVKLSRFRERSDLRPMPPSSHRVPQIPLGLECQPDLSVPSRQRLEQEGGIGADTATPLDDGVEALKGNVHPLGRLHLGHAMWFKELLQQYFPRGGSVGGWPATCAAPHQWYPYNTRRTRRVRQAEDDSILAVLCLRTRKGSARTRVLRRT